MKHILPKSIDTLTEKLSQLPGIGPKSASRLTFALLTRPQEFLDQLSEAVQDLKKSLHPCPRCSLITDQLGDCVICEDGRRDHSILCVVEESLDVVALEGSRGFAGYYHVLGGVVSPIDGIGPEQLNIKSLVSRLADDSKVVEVIIATNPSLEGEATALYIAQAISHFNVRVTRIARGLPSGGDLEYADEVTLQRALEGRQMVKEKEGR